MSSHITLNFGHVNRVQDLGVVVNAESSNHMSSVLLVLLFVFDLKRQAQMLSRVKFELIFVKNDNYYTYITGYVCVSTSGKDRDSVTFHFKLLGFGFLPVVLVTVLERVKSSETL